jgi:HlyD family secretion protein
MNKKKKIILGAGILAVMAMIGIVYAGGGTEVEMVEVRTGDLTRVVTDTGYVQAATDYVLHTSQSVRVVDVPVESGQPVQPGQTLVVLENLDLSVQIAEARSQQSQANAAVAAASSSLERARLELREAEQNFARVQQLHQAGAVSQADYEKATTLMESCRQNVAGSEAGLAGAQLQADGIGQVLDRLGAKKQQLVVKSPIAGVVLNLPVEREQVLMPGLPLVTVGSPDLLEVRADILSDDLGGVMVGQRATVAAPVLGPAVLEGEVRKIYPQAGEKVSALGVIQRRVPVIITLKENGNLKPGFEVKVNIETESRKNVLVVPREAVRTAESGQKELLAVVGGRVQRRTVKTGAVGGGNVEITGGLQAGEVIVKDGSMKLEEGARVKPLKNSARNK